MDTTEDKTVLENQLFSRWSSDSDLSISEKCWRRVYLDPYPDIQDGSLIILLSFAAWLVLCK